MNVDHRLILASDRILDRVYECFILVIRCLGPRLSHLQQATKLNTAFPRNIDSLLQNRFDHLNA